MANKQVDGKNPIIFDTAATTVTGPFRIRALYWTGFTAGHDLKITEGLGGRTLFELVGGVDTTFKMENLSLPCEKLYIVTIDGGEVSIYING